MADVQTLYKTYVINFAEFASRRLDILFDVYAHGGKMCDGDSSLKKLMMTAVTHPDVVFSEAGCDCARHYRIAGWSKV